MKEESRQGEEDDTNTTQRKASKEMKRRTSKHTNWRMSTNRKGRVVQNQVAPRKVSRKGEEDDTNTIPITASEIRGRGRPPINTK